MRLHRTLRCRGESPYDVLGRRADLVDGVVRGDVVRADSVCAGADRTGP
jgi:hypothetical protein